MFYLIFIKWEFLYCNFLRLISQAGKKKVRTRSSYLLRLIFLEKKIIVGNYQPRKFYHKSATFAKIFFDETGTERSTHTKKKTHNTVY